MSLRDGGRRALVGIAALAAGFSILMVLAVLLEEKLIYFPSRELDVTPAELALDHDELDIRASDGARIHGWFLPAPREGSDRYTVLFSHGNAGNVSHRLDRVVRMHSELGIDVLLFDYRGFGRSEGRPSEEGTYRDARAAYDYLIERRSICPGRIVLFGESLGAAVAVQLATEVEAAALVLEAPFTSIPEMAKVAYPLLPVSGLVRTRYDNLAKISGIRLPKLIIHGREDPVVPPSQGEALYRKAAEPKRFLPIDGGGHSDAYVVGGDVYWNAWRELLARLTP